MQYSYRVNRRIIVKRRQKRNEMADLPPKSFSWLCSNSWQSAQICTLRSDIFPFYELARANPTESYADCDQEMKGFSQPT